MDQVIMLPSKMPFLEAMLRQGRLGKLPNIGAWP